MKYAVLKLDDIEHYCSEDQLNQLADICKTVIDGRLKDNKHSENKYYIVNNDEPYANEVKEIIEKYEGEEIIFEF